MGVGDILLYENWKKNPFLEKEFLDNRSYAGVVFLLHFGICNGGDTVDDSDKNFC